MYHRLSRHNGAGHAICPDDGSTFAPCMFLGTNTNRYGVVGASFPVNLRPGLAGARAYATVITTWDDRYGCPDGTCDKTMPKPDDNTAGETEVITALYIKLKEFCYVSSNCNKTRPKPNVNSVRQIEMFTELYVKINEFCYVSLNWACERVNGGRERLLKLTITAKYGVNVASSLDGAVCVLGTGECCVGSEDNKVARPGRGCASFVRFCWTNRSACSRDVGRTGMWSQMDRDSSGVPMRRPCQGTGVGVCYCCTDLLDHYMDMGTGPGPSRGRVSDRVLLVMFSVSGSAFGVRVFLMASDAIFYSNQPP